jgi:predicted amidohydrolase
MATIDPARTLHLDHEHATLHVGRGAEVSVLRLVTPEGGAHLTDGFETITASERLVPVGCMRAGEWIPATAALAPEMAAPPSS